jgi:pentatricopeptide repeat protein
MIDDCNTFLGKKVIQAPKVNDFSSAALIEKAAHNRDFNFAINLYQSLTGFTKPDIRIVTAMLDACLKCNQEKKALAVIDDMIKHHVQPNDTCLAYIAQVHASLNDVKSTLDALSKMRNVDAKDCKIIMKRFGKDANQAEGAVAIFDFMDQRKIPIDTLTYFYVLTACMHAGAIARGQRVHQHLLKSGTMITRNLEALIVNMYSKEGYVAEVAEIFPTIDLTNKGIDPNTWFKLIGHYVKRGDLQATMELVAKARACDVKLSGPLFINILNLCAENKDLEAGKAVHTLTQGMKIMIF